MMGKKKYKFCDNKIFFHAVIWQLSFYPSKDSTPVRIIIFNVYCGTTFMSPDGLIRSVGTSSQTPISNN